MAIDLNNNEFWIWKWEVIWYELRNSTDPQSKKIFYESIKKRYFKRT